MNVSIDVTVIPLRSIEAHVSLNMQYPSFFVLTGRKTHDIPVYYPRAAH